MCGTLIEIKQPAVAKMYCSDACRRAGLARRRKGESRRYLTKKAQTKYNEMSSKIVKLKEQLKLYENMFAAQECEVRELKQDKIELRKELDVARTQHESQSYDKNNNLYRKKSITNRRGSD